MIFNSNGLTLASNKICLLVACSEVVSILLGCEEWTPEMKRLNMSHICKEHISFPSRFTDDTLQKFRHVWQSLSLQEGSPSQVLRPQVSGVLGIFLK